MNDVPQPEIVLQTRVEQSCGWMTVEAAQTSLFGLNLYVVGTVVVVDGGLF